MKKIIMMAVLALGVAIAANAQPRAIGARFGWGTEVTYQHTVHANDFVELNLGAYGFDALNIASTYNFMIAQPQWTNKGEWGFYAGPGLAITTGFRDVAISVAGQIGLEYTFWFPLQLSIDLRPQIGVHIHKGGAHYFNDGLFGFTPTLSVRYRF